MYGQLLPIFGAPYFHCQMIHEIKNVLNSAHFRLYLPIIVSYLFVCVYATTGIVPIVYIRLNN